MFFKTNMFHKVLSIILSIAFVSTNSYAYPDKLRIPMAGNKTVIKGLERGKNLLNEYKDLRADYLAGTIETPTHPLDKMIRISDISSDPHIDITNLTKTERQVLIEKVVSYFRDLKARNGKIGIGIMLAGSASRMRIGNNLPSVLEQAQKEDPERFGRNIKELPDAKALLPAAKVNGRWMTFLDLYLINCEKMNNAFEKLGLGMPFVPAPLTNEEYQPDFIREIRRANKEGIHSVKPEDITFYYQRLGYRIAATAEDVAANSNKFEFEKDGKMVFDQEAYKKAFKFAEKHGGEILTDVIAPEGHGEAAHAFFETAADMEKPLFADFMENNIEYYYTHNVDNMAFVDENWLLIFANMIDKDLNMVLAGSKKVKGPAGKGGGFTEFKGNARQMEDDVYKASAKKYNFDRESDEVLNNPKGDNPEANNDATLFIKFPDAFANAYDDERLKDKTKVLNLTEKDYSEIAAKGRRNFGLSPTYKFASREGEPYILTVTFETRLWEIQNGNTLGTARNLSVPDIDDGTSTDKKKVRFAPLKSKVDYDNISLQDSREAISNYIVNDNPLSEDFISAANARKFADAVPEAIKTRDIIGEPIDKEIAKKTDNKNKLASNAALIGNYLDDSVKGDNAAYSALKNLDKSELMQYFESNVNKTIEQLPEDLFGFGFGYDIRGNAMEVNGGEVNITPENFYAVGKLIGLAYARQGEKGLVTGDGRLHTPILRYCLALGAASVGVNADFSEDALTTGAHNVYSAENPRGHKFQLQVSGSHGVFQKNGVKMKVDFGKGKVDPLYAEDLSDLWQDRMAILAKAKNRKIGSVNEVTGVLDSIIEMYDKTLPSMDKPEIIVLDTRAGNAGEQNYKFFKKRGFEVVDMDEVLGVKGVPEADMASLIAEKKDVILSILKQKWHDGNKQIVLMLNAHSDPYMRRGIWDPSKKEAMQACVQLVKLVNDNLEGDMPKVFGGVYDGDADRFGAVKENGEAIEAFEMTIPYYQRFLLDPQNMDAIAKIVKSGGEPIWLACDVRANSKLEKVLKRTNDIIKNKYGLRQDVIKAVYINTGYPPQLSFVEWRIAKMREYIENTPELKNDGQFTEDFLHLAQTYYTAEASGHNFFHAAPGNLERPCDCGMAALVAEINIRETAAGIEAKYADMGDKEEYTLVDIYDSFPGTFTSSELRLFIPNSIKIETAHRLGKWLKDKYSADLKEITFAEPVKEGNMLLQPAEDGFITVAGYKAQLKNGDSILIRWSNTGEQLQLLFEGNTLESLVAKMTEVEQRLKEEEGVGLIVTDLSKDIESIRKQLNNESTRTMASKYKPTNKDIEQYAQVIGDPTEASHIVEHYTSIAGASKILPFVFGNGQGRMINKKLLEEIEKGNIIVSIAEMPNDHQVYLKGVNKKKDDPRGKLASNMSITDKNRREGMLSKLQSEDMIGQMARLYGKSFEEAEALNASKIAKIGFETKKDGSKVNRLGWTPENLKWLLNNPDKIDQVLKDAEYIRSKYKYVIFCGMGGSGLSVQTVKTTFGEKDIKIYSLRTTDPAVIKHILENEISKDAGSLQNALAETLVIPISKSGTTKETVSHKEYSEELFAQEGININDHMRVITDKGSPMDTGDYTQREIQLNGRSDIGGRFTSPTTNIFLLPLALVAPDKVKDVLEIALKMNEIGDINKDDFIKLGAYLYDMALKDKDKVTYMAPEELKDFPMWSEQIIEESLGKDGKGVTAFYGEDISKDSLKNVNENDRVFLRINIAGKETNKEFTDYLKNNNYPVFDIDVDSIDSIGGLMLGFARTVATVAYLWDICFVDQPAVEGYKDATREVMAALKPGEKVNVPESWKKVSYGKLNLYYDRLMKVGAITEDEISKEVESLGVAMDDAPAVYAAVINILKGKPGFEAMEISSYGKMTGNMETILKKARKNIFTDGLKMASKLGEGPDKNHSYHQNIEAGKDMWLSTYFMPLQVEQPEALEYDDNLIKAQTIGTVNSIVKQGRKVTLITFDSTIKEAEGDLADFFGEVESYLSKDKIKPNNASNESLIDEVNKAFSEGKYGDALKVIDKAIQSEIAFGRNEYREIEKAKKRIMSKIIVIAASKVIQDRGVIAKKTTPESAVVIVAMDEKEYVAVKDIKGVNVKALNGEWVNKYKELDKARILNLSKDQTDVLKDQLMIYNDVIDLGSLNSHIIDKAIIRSLASNV